MQNTNPQLVTHARPHIDDVMAIWLIKTFCPDFKDAEVSFIAKGKDEEPVPVGAIAIGIGGGQFDEHKGDVGESATSLVWKWLQKQPGFSVTETDRLALERLIHWVHREDLGEIKTHPWWEWSITIPVEYSYDVFDGDNARVYEFGAQTLAATFAYYQGLAQLDVDWEKRIEFESQWGKAVALESPASGLSQRAWKEGAVMVIQINPDEGQRQFRAKVDSPVDFTETYQKVRDLEPEASWFLHHEKRMLLCGSRTASTFNPSKLSLQELIDLVKS